MQMQISTADCLRRFGRHGVEHQPERSSTTYPILHGFDGGRVFGQTVSHDYQSRRDIQSFGSHRQLTDVERQDDCLKSRLPENISEQFGRLQLLVGGIADDGKDGLLSC